VQYVGKIRVRNAALFGKLQAGNTCAVHTPYYFSSPIVVQNSHLLSKKFFKKQLKYFNFYDIM
jgi:hypothetical protein